MSKISFYRGGTAGIAGVSLVDGQVLFDTTKRELGFDVKKGNSVERVWLDNDTNSIPDEYIDVLFEDDDILIFPSADDFPTTGDATKIYYATDTGTFYKWTLDGYVEYDISDSALVYMINDATGDEITDADYIPYFDLSSNKKKRILFGAIKTIMAGIYENKVAVENGTAVSLVTTGDKYRWDHLLSNITVDAEPTADSGNPVSSGGVYTALGNKVDTSAVGSVNGVASLDSTGRVPTSQLPGFVDDVVEGYYYSTNGKFYKESTFTTEITGEADKLYVDLTDNLIYRWSGSVFVQISSSLALGETSTTAYRGDRGKAAYDHASDSSKLTTAKTSGLYKIGTTAQGHVASATAVVKADITALGIPGQDTTYESKAAAQNGTDVSLVTTGEKYEWNNMLNYAGTVTKVSTGVGLTGGDITSTGTVKAKLKSETASNLASAAMGSTSSRQYAVGVDKDGYLSTNIPWTDTTYESKTAVQNGTDVSLVTTGEKYAWNNKTSNTGTVTSVSTGVGLTGGDITSTGTIKAKLKSETASTLDSTAMGSTASRQYAVGVDKSGYLSVNIPWSNTTYESKAAVQNGTDLSLVTTGEKYTWNNKTSNTGTVTKVSTGVGLTGGDVTSTGTIKAKLKSETASTLASAAMGSTSSRQYAVGVDKDGYLSVNVPWTNDNTWVANSSSAAGYVASGSGQNKKAWMTDASGNPAWRDYDAMTPIGDTYITGLFSGDNILVFDKRADFPATGDSTKMYYAIDTEKFYTWDGTQYVEYDISSGTVRAVYTGIGLTGGPITTTGTLKVNLKTETVSSLTAVAKGSTANREYAVGVDSNGHLSVNIPWADTTYTSKAAVSGGTDVSLVTTGEKYTWNSKAASNHTHGLTLATDTGTSAISLAANTKYKLTAGGSTLIFTTPADSNTTYTSKAAAENGTEVSLCTTGEKYIWNNKASSSHTHTLSLATDTGTSTITLAHATKYKLTAGGSTLIFTTPSDSNTTYTAGVGMTLASGAFKTKLKSETASTLASASMGSTSSRQYAVGVDKNGYLSVNIPWTDTVYSPTIMSQTLTAGSTSVTFANVPTTGTNLIDVYTSVAGLDYTDMTETTSGSSKSVTVTYDAQSSAVTVYLKIHTVT